MFLLIIAILMITSIGVMVEGYPLYKAKQWPQLGVLVTLLIMAAGIGIAQILYLELDSPLGNLIELLPAMFDPVVDFLQCID